jgi:hypothetical protein
MGEIAADLWAGFVDRAEVPVEEDAPLQRIPQNSEGGRVGIWNGVKAGDCLGRGAYVRAMFSISDLLMDTTECRQQFAQAVQSTCCRTSVARI